MDINHHLSARDRVWPSSTAQELPVTEQSKMPPLTETTLGARIVEARESRGWNRETFRKRLQAHSPELAETGYSTVFNWEADKKIPKMPALMAIAQLTGYSVEELAEGPKDAADEFGGSLTPSQVERLLGTMGASPRVAKEVMAELAAYPPKGGISRDEVVKIHRLLIRRVEEDNASADRARGASSVRRARPLAKRPAK
jgi:transcriptional regulator with XRE-family HTH domain